jgi:hypothetical protein
VYGSVDPDRYREAMRLLADLDSKTVSTPAPLEFKRGRLG